MLLCAPVLDGSRAVDTCCRVHTQDVTTFNFLQPVETGTVPSPLQVKLGARSHLLRVSSSAELPWAGSSNNRRFSQSGAGSPRSGAR